MPDNVITLVAPVAPLRGGIAQHSGELAAAYHYRKPVLATAVGGLKDVVVENATGRLCEPASVPALTALLERFHAEPMQGVAEAIDELAASMTFGHMAAAMAAFVEEGDR